MASRKKPAVLYIVATLNLILGIPCLCCMTCAGVMTVAGETMKPPGGAQADPNNPFAKAAEQVEEQQKFMEKEVGGYKALEIAFMVVAILFSLCLLISAIGLFMGEGWGRWLCIVACALMILIGIGNAGWRAAVVLPAAKRFHDQQVAAGKAPPSGNAFAIGGGAGVAINLVWTVAYPILAIALLMFGPAATFFSNKGRRDDLDRGEDDWDRRDNEYDDRGRDRYDRDERDDYDR